MQPISIYMTFPDPDSAKTVIQILLNKRAIACANLFSDVTSFYWWENAIQEDAEVVVIAKSTADKKESILELLDQHHPYEVPCVLFSDIAGGYPAYLKWLKAETQVGEP